jgi:GWxTD domain-containing protein
LMLAEDQYRNFIIFFPQNPKAQDAQLKIISILMRQMQDPERDQKKEMIRAEAEIRKFIKWFPTSEYVPIVEKYKEEIARKLLESDLNPAGAAPEKSPESIQANMLTDTYRRWLQEEAVYIISKEERNAFLSLTTDEERAMFINQFWARRNPDPRASSNSAKLEHYRRIAYANEHFTCAIAGWKTDRGRIYILFGESEGKESHPSAGALPREAWEGGGETGAYPYELWRYDRHAGVGSTVFMFVDRFKDGSFPLLAAKSPEGQSLQAGALTLASSVVSAPPVFDGTRFRQGTLKVVPKGTPEYTNGQTLIPYLEIYDVAVDRATGKPTLLISFIIKLGNRVVAHIEDAEARTCQWSEKGLAIVGSIPLKDMEPGNYLLMVRVQDRITERTLETAADFNIIRSPVRSPAPD